MYRAIDSKTWIDPKFKRLDPLEKYIFLYLITNIHSHVTGLYYLPIVYMSHELSLEEKKVKQIINKLSETNMIRYDPEHEVVWVINMFKYQCKSKKLQKALDNQICKFDHCELSKQVQEYYVNNNHDTLSIPYLYPIDTLSIPDLGCQNSFGSERYPILSGKNSTVYTDTDTETETETETEKEINLSSKNLKTATKKTKPKTQPSAKDDTHVIEELHKHWCETMGRDWDIEKEVVLVAKHRNLVRRFISRFGIDKCKRAHYGYARMVAKHKPESVAFRLAYPEVRDNNGGPDYQRFSEWIISESIKAKPKTTRTNPKSTKGMFMWRGEYFSRAETEKKAQEYDGSLQQEYMLVRAMLDYPNWKWPKELYKYFENHLRKEKQKDDERRMEKMGEIC